MSEQKKEQRRIYSLIERWVFTLLLFNYLLICLGLPLPAVAPQPSEMANSAPFPCQGHGCGCRSAEHCCKNCCCKTNQQKLAWAKQNNIKPPEYVIAAAATESPVAVKSCCAKKKKQTQTACGVPSSSPAVNAAKNKKPIVDLVFYVEAERCRGGSASEWIVTPISLPMNRSTLIWDCVQVTDFLSNLSEKIPTGPAYPPPSPPPRNV